MARQTATRGVSVLLQDVLVLSVSAEGPLLFTAVSDAVLELEACRALLELERGDRRIRHALKSALPGINGQTEHRRSQHRPCSEPFPCFSWFSRKASLLTSSRLAAKLE